MPTLTEQREDQIYLSVHDVAKVLVEGPIEMDMNAPNGWTAHYTRIRIFTSDGRCVIVGCSNVDHAFEVDRSTDVPQLAPAGKAV